MILACRSLGHDCLVYTISGLVGPNKENYTQFLKFYLSSYCLHRPVKVLSLTQFSYLSFEVPQCFIYIVSRYVSTKLQSNMYIEDKYQFSLSRPTDHNKTQKFNIVHKAIDCRRVLMFLGNTCSIALAVMFMRQFV